jgi:hypothetical protein
MEVAAMHGKSKMVELGALVLRSSDWLSIEVLSADHPKQG